MYIPSLPGFRLLRKIANYPDIQDKREFHRRIEIDKLQKELDEKIKSKKKIN